MFGDVHYTQKQGVLLIFYANPRKLRLIRVLFTICITLRHFRKGGSYEKPVLSGDKWTATLESRFAAELIRVKAKIVADVKSLAARYAVTLPDAERTVKDLSAKVAGHLAAMGIEV